MMDFKAPFPWFGGKSRVAGLVWERFGDVLNYVEPFFGSGAVLLGRPHEPRTETANDKDGYVANFWRAVQHDPDAVAHYANWPVNENDLTARHLWLVNQNIVPRLEGDPDWYDAKIAGWWVWGMACWIGGEFCSGNGPWVSVDGVLVNRNDVNDAGVGVNRRRVHLGNAGVGVNRQLVHLGSRGAGVNQRRVHLGNAGKDCNPGAGECGLVAWMQALSDRLRRVRVTCGDWSRVCGSSPTYYVGTTAVFLDPPYSAEADRGTSIYSEEDLSIAHDVRDWCLANGDNPKMRIALCGYEGEHDMPDSWECVEWSTAGSYGRENSKAMDNRHRERIWFSPHCLKPAVHTQMDIFGEVTS